MFFFITKNMYSLMPWHSSCVFHSEEVESFIAHLLFLCVLCCLPDRQLTEQPRHTIPAPEKMPGILGHHRRLKGQPLNFLDIDDRRHKWIFSEQTLAKSPLYMVKNSRKYTRKRTPTKVKKNDVFVQKIKIFNIFYFV